MTIVLNDGSSFSDDSFKRQSHQPTTASVVVSLSRLIVMSGEVHRYEVVFIAVEKGWDV